MVNKGFSLIENVVAIFLVGIVIAATIFSFATARMYAASARHHYQAVSIARDGIERITAGEDLVPETTASIATVIIDSDPILTGERKITPLFDQKVVVIVSWTEKMWGDIDKKEKIVLFLP